MLFLSFLQEYFKKSIGHSHICLPLSFLLYSKKKLQRGFSYAIHCFYFSWYLCFPAHSFLTLPSGGKIKADSAIAVFSPDRHAWAAAHETLALAILFCLLAFSVISWLFSFKNAIHDRKYYKALEEDINWQVKRARDNGISMDSVYFDSAGNMRYKNTKEIVD